MLEHFIDEDGNHDEDSCYPCLMKLEVKGDCRCGICCRQLILEALPEDAELEPRIKECSPLKDIDGQLEGYLLNAKDGPCTFLDRATNHCSIYPTRPLMCRL